MNQRQGYAQQQVLQQQKCSDTGTLCQRKLRTAYKILPQSKSPVCLQVCLSTCLPVLISLSSPSSVSLRYCKDISEAWHKASWLLGNYSPRCCSSASSRWLKRILMQTNRKKITFFNVAMSLQSRGKVVVYPMNSNNVKLSYDVLQSRHTAHKEVGTGGGGVRRWGGLQIHPLLAVATFAISFARYIFHCSTLGKSKAQAS